jgi:N-formylglutamate amidohydrolase
MDLPVPSPIDTRADAAPFTLHRPIAQTTPLVFASAHSGRAYPAHFIEAARLDRMALRRSEDCFVDELFADAPTFGAPLLAAEFPRAYCDANRERWELDPAMFDDRLPSWVNTTSPRVGAGLGTLARVVASGEAIYRGKLPFAEAERRIRQCWEPYHQALAALIMTTQASFDVCLLIDCHSMPAHGMAARGGMDADIVLGDAHGTSCAPSVTRFVERSMAAQGYAVRRNDPYAGGFVTRHYGAPAECVHVLQIEVARRLYMDEARIEKTDRFAALRRDLGALIAALSEAARGLLNAPMR